MNTILKLPSLCCWKHFKYDLVWLTWLVDQEILKFTYEIVSYIWILTNERERGPVLTMFSFLCEHVTSFWNASLRIVFICIFWARLNKTVKRTTMFYFSSLLRQHDKHQSGRCIFLWMVIHKKPTNKEKKMYGP